ncbi:MAG: hypothetical protein KJZ80_02430 [Hyphomicrobiaceae bacterium]|nr:hypothetical protein [Hyphomicrobiaceae bacterium]
MLRYRITVGLLLLTMSAGASCAMASEARIYPHIVWRVENPFRFFADPADTKVHRATFLELTDEEHETPVLAAERALAKRHADGWASVVLGRTCWEAEKNRHICPDGTDYINPQSHAVVAELKGIPDAASVDCLWLTSPKGPDAPRGQAVTARCSEPVELDVPYPNGAHVAVEVGGREVAATDATVTDLFIVGMGDSFGSGEGNPDLPVRFSRERTAAYGNGSNPELAGYPVRVGGWRQIGDDKFIQENARWLDQACHRSLYSHQLRAALQLSLEDPHRAVTFVGIACSGAEVSAGLFLRYKGNEWVSHPPELSQISAVAEAQCGKHKAPPHDLPEAYHIRGRIPELKGLVLRKCEAEHARRIDLLMISIGGNDVGFSRLVADAVLTDKSMLKRLGGWLGQVEGAAAANEQLAVLDARYKSLNRAIRNILHVPWNESDRILLTAYPGLALLEDGSTVCPSGRAGMDVLRDFKLSAAKAREGSALAGRLNAAMRESAREHGWSFVESHRKAFLGRGICAGWSDAAFSTADDLRLPRNVNGVWEPYNPADYKPYASRQRWFRTPNDAFLTGNFHVSASLLQKVLRVQTLSWFQLVLASTYSGAFHPTAEGQAAIADAVVETARGVLAKYENERM